MARQKVEKPADDAEVMEAGVEMAPAEVNEEPVIMTDDEMNRMATRILREARNADITDALNGRINQLKRQLAIEKAKGK